MTKTNDLLFYYEKMYKIRCQLLRKSWYSEEEFKMMVYFIHRFNPIDIKEFIESKGLMYQDPNDIQIDESTDLDKPDSSSEITDSSNEDSSESTAEHNVMPFERRYRYEQIWQFQETMIKQVH